MIIGAPIRRAQGIDIVKRQVGSQDSRDSDVCWNFRKGVCRKGNACPWRHVVDDAPRAQSQSTLSQGQRHGTDGARKVLPPWHRASVTCAARKADAERVAGSSGTPGACAYVCVLWASDDSNREVAAAKTIMDALVLGFSLMGRRRHDNMSGCFSSRHKRIILATQDMLNIPGFDVLRTVWEVRLIEHVKVSPTMLVKSHTRFAKVFTKLRVWELEEFHRVLLLDSDLLVRDGNSIDELFEHAAPCALFRGRMNHVPGKARPQHTYYDRERNLVGGINGGVVLLEPSREKFEEMAKALLDTEHPWHVPSKAPEQDLLSRVFNTEFHGLHSKYNWQLHQLLLPTKEDDMKGDRFRISFEEVRIVHYSTAQKPSSLWIDDRSIHDWLDEYISKHGRPLLESIRADIITAVIEWNGKLVEAWGFAVNQVAKGPARSSRGLCLLCGRPCEIDAQHCFCECPDVEDLRQQWRDLRQQKTPLTLDNVMDPPEGGRMVDALRLLGAMYRTWNIGMRRRSSVATADCSKRRCTRQDAENGERSNTKKKNKEVKPGAGDEEEDDDRGNAKKGGRKAAAGKARVDDRSGHETASLKKGNAKASANMDHAQAAPLSQAGKDSKNRWDGATEATRKKLDPKSKVRQTVAALPTTRHGRRSDDDANQGGLKKGVSAAAKVHSVDDNDDETDYNDDDEKMIVPKKGDLVSSKARARLATLNARVEPSTASEDSEGSEDGGHSKTSNPQRHGLISGTVRVAPAKGKARLAQVTSSHDNGESGDDLDDDDDDADHGNQPMSVRRRASVATADGFKRCRTTQDPEDYDLKQGSVRLKPQLTLEVPGAQPVGMRRRTPVATTDDSKRCRTKQAAENCLERESVRLKPQLSHAFDAPGVQDLPVETSPWIGEAFDAPDAQRLSAETSPWTGEKVVAIRACVGWFVDSITFVPNHGECLKCGGNGGEEVGPWELQDGEVIQSLEIWNPDANVDCVGGGIIFYTSFGHKITVKPLPRKRRYCVVGKAPQSYEICGLRFSDGFVSAVIIRPLTRMRKRRMSD